MDELAKIAVEEINNYKSNATIMDFVNNEALEKVASEIRASSGSATTAKAVKLLAIRHKSIADRVEQYVNIGLIGCYMASIKI